MRTIVITGLLIAVFGLWTVSAETWAQLRNRANAMSNAVFAARADPGFDIWNHTDRIAAVWATHDWVFDAFVNMRDNHPSLSQQERDRYQLFLVTHRLELERMEAALFRLDARTFNTIRSRHAHWFNHLRNGGTITFR